MPENKLKNIIDVIPLIRIPLGKRPVFSYLAEKKLLEGTLVAIPFHNKKIEGVVIKKYPGEKSGADFKLKNIESVIEESFLDKKQLALAEFLSEYYISPFGTILKNFIPKRAKMRKVSNKISPRLPQKIILTREQLSAVKEISQKTRNQKIEARKYLLFGPSASGKTEVYIHSIKKLREKNSKLQFLILLPELTLTPQAIERYGEHFSPEETVILNSHISKGQFFSNWEKIKSGEAKIIIGSRMAVFAPFQKLGLIVIDEEQDISFKQWDMNPRYDARLVTEKLAKLHQCPIIFGSATPRIETYFKAITKKISLLTLPLLPINLSLRPPILSLIDMKKERWSKNYSPISKKLKSEIAYALKNNLQTILFINRQGMSAFSICEQCKTVLKCPTCDRALVYDESGQYRCLHCNYKTSIIPECSKCHSISFKNIGLGTQKVEKEIKNLFPGTRILRADSQSLRGAQSPEKIYEEFSKGQADILIGTQLISKGWDLPNVALIGIIDADDLLSIPDFLANEKAFQHIIQVAGRTNRPGAKFPGQVLIQTFNPENKFLQMAARRDFASFYQQEITEREALKLPPFSRLIRLIFQDFKLSLVQKETGRLYDLLKNELSVSPPQDLFVSKIRGKFRQQILIKIKSESELEKIKKFLENLPNGWIIDVDPTTTV